MQRRNRKRYALVAALMLGSLLAGNLPYLVAATVIPPGWRFWPAPPMNYSDASQYLAFTRMSVDGEWLLGDPFTSEAVPPRLILPQVYVQAGIARLCGSDVPMGYQAGRVLSGGMLLAACAGLGLALLPHWRTRWLYLLLIGYGAGAGWIADLAWPELPHGDRLQPEANTLFSLGNLPHLSLSAALLSLLFLGIHRAETRVTPTLLAGVGLSAALLSWTHPFDFVSLGLAVAAYLPLRLLRPTEDRGALLRRLGLLLGTVLLCALPAAAYLFHIVKTDPHYAALANDRSSVRPWSFYLIAHGPLLVAAALNSCRPQRLAGRLLLPACWVAGVLLFLATPFRLGGKQHRLLGGIHAPLAVLAAAGLDAASSRSRRGARVPAYCGLAGGLLLVTLPGGAAITRRHLAAYSRPDPAYFLSPWVQSLIRGLDAAAAPGDVALAGPFSSTWIPVLTRLRVYHGHWHMTLDEGRKRRERDWFFSPTAAPERTRWLNRNRVGWVLWYPREWGSTLPELPGGTSLLEVGHAPEGRVYSRMMIPAHE